MDENLIKLPEIRGKYRYKANLQKMNWFGVGGCAEVLFIPADAKDLQSFLLAVDPTLPITVIGIGSNTLVRDGGLRGVVIRLGAGFNYIHHNHHEELTAGAAALDVNVANYCLEQCLTNLEFLSGIPGTIGGALYMNAGAYGTEIAEVLLSAQVISMQGELQVLQCQDFQYKYRENNLPNRYIFIEARLAVKQGIHDDIKNMMDNIRSARNLSQPIKAKTGGSTFKNPHGNSAWKLIDQAGCRGLRIGGAFVSQQHCNFIINEGHATANDIESLILEVQNKVFVATGIMLKPEIKIIGEKK